MWNSAGVGRTGTLIALYTQMQRLRSEQTVDIYTFVKQMRKDRNNMVQTEVSVLEVEFNDFIFTMLLNGVCNYYDIPIYSGTSLLQPPMNQTFLAVK